MKKKFNIGIDLDNTILNYEDVYRKLSIKLLNDNSITDKDSFKKKIISQYGEDKWTMLQGIVYGSYLNYAKFSKGFFEFIKLINNFSVIYVVSHKTKKPFVGKNINLRNKAIARLKKSKKFSQFIKIKNIHFCNTIEEKIKTIKKLNCDFFIDDLIFVFTHHLFPKNTRCILFSKFQNIKEVNFVSDNWYVIYLKILNAYPK